MFDSWAVVVVVVVGFVVGSGWYVVVAPDDALVGDHCDYGAKCYQLLVFLGDSVAVGYYFGFDSKVVRHHGYYLLHHWMDCY